jgi:hypothetical protein
MTESANTILLIADISGYTKFIKQHAVSVSHAKQIIVRLLGSLIQASKPPLKVAELEGDAVFFYARATKNDLDEVAEQVKSQILVLFSVFNKELSLIDSVTTCPCDACNYAHDLQLKQVVHAGEVELIKVEQFEKPFGIDVILVHRMLKNSVQSNEYVMMTNPVFDYVKDFFGLLPERYKESFEGVGEVETLVFYPKQLGHAIETISLQVPTIRKPSLFDKVRWRSLLTMQTLADWLGLLKFKGKFKSVPT